MCSGGWRRVLYGLVEPESIPGSWLCWRIVGACCSFAAPGPLARAVASSSSSVSSWPSPSLWLVVAVLCVFCGLRCPREVVPGSVSVPLCLILQGVTTANFCRTALPPSLPALSCERAPCGLPIFTSCRTALAPNAYRLVRRYYRQQFTKAAGWQSGVLLLLIIFPSFNL